MMARPTGARFARFEGLQLFHAPRLGIRFYAQAPRVGFAIPGLSHGSRSSRTQTVQTSVQNSEPSGLALPLPSRNMLEATAIQVCHGAISPRPVTSQIPIDSWHAAIGDPTLADAILDRLVHNAHRFMLSGESMRKHRNGLTTEPEKE